MNCRLSTDVDRDTAESYSYLFHLAKPPLLPSELPQFFVARIQQGAGNISRDFGSYWHDSIGQLLQVHNANPLFQLIPKVLNWIGILVTVEANRSTVNSWSGSRNQFAHLPQG